ncbi:MAG: 1-(5-phosphoribosyl)-5-((5-phosphoribosylamino)methylideneamino)imidazole-4-carboxamide isomerase, partial [Chloroflexi bacterium]|nr:1-(5-phosphoribosyl)-5-((5-phosphoribosylamino)methylideneamino)imidazole-4-carboxamide isomerase [Chloroflexota bacterium]
IYTDIAADGTLAAPNLAAVKEVVTAASVPVIAAGGISSVDNLCALQRIGVEAAILGRALYVGAVDLKKAKEALRHV